MIKEKRAELPTRLLIASNQIDKYLNMENFSIAEAEGDAQTVDNMGQGFHYCNSCVLHGKMFVAWPTAREEGAFHF
jgi:hypothetical protein